MFLHQLLILEMPIPKPSGGYKITTIKNFNAICFCINTGFHHKQVVLTVYRTILFSHSSLSRLNKSIASKPLYIVHS